MEIYSIKPYFQKLLSPIANVFIKLKVHPTIINLLALLISILVGLLLYFKNIFSFFLLLVPFLVFIRIAFNALDGMVARGLKVASSRGEIYNEFFDRLSDISIFTGLSLSFIKKSDIVNHQFSINKNIIFSLKTKAAEPSLAVTIPLILGFIFLTLVLLNSYLGILSKSAGGKRIYTGILGKADRMFYLGVACIVFFFYRHEIVWIIFFILTIIAIIISIGQRLWKTLQSFKN